MEIGTKVVVFYTDDVVWHERMVFLPGHEPNMYWVLTPDDDVYEEDLGGNAEDGPDKVRVVPPGIRTLANLRTGVYRFRGDMDDAFLEEKIREALQSHTNAYGARPELDSAAVRLPSGTHKQLSDLQPRRRLRGKRDTTAVQPGDVSAILPSPRPRREGVLAEAWVVIYSATGKDLGSQVTPPSSSQVVTLDGKHFRLYSEDGGVVMAQGCTAEEAPDVSRVAKGATSGEAAEERDLRVLPIIFDSADERWRTLSEAVPEYEELDFEDFPLQGPRTVYHDVRQLRRQGLDWIQHHESWLKKSGVRLTDRSVHEHSAICRVLNLMTSYDQLNLPSLASSEALNRRRTLIEIAHQGRPEAPSYEGSEEIMGVKESADGALIDPALTRHAARRQADRAEVMKQNRLAAEERRHARNRGEDGERPEKPEKPPKRKGDGKGGDKTQGAP